MTVGRNGNGTLHVELNVVLHYITEYETGCVSVGMGD